MFSVESCLFWYNWFILLYWSIAGVSYTTTYIYICIHLSPVNVYLV